MDDTPRVAFLRHEGSRFDREVVGQHLAAKTNLVGEITIKPKIGRKLDTLKHEFRRSGFVGLLDSLAFRAHYRLSLASTEEEKINGLIDTYDGKVDSLDVDTQTVTDPNSNRMCSILDRFDADVLVARTKVLLDERVYSRPTKGTFVIHPGVCPEYRNQHGCFWALANGEPDRVGYSLIRIDSGIDTGEIFAQNGTKFHRLEDEHAFIEKKVVSDNLDEITTVLNDLSAHDPIDTEDRESGLWGMPKLSAWQTWKHRDRVFNRGEYDSTLDA